MEQVSPQGNVLGNDILLVEGIEETSTFQGVIALRPQILRYPWLTPQNQHGAAIVFHRP
jgi:hypothetical protein